jgi:hypothetical protein
MLNYLETGVTGKWQPCGMPRAMMKTGAIEHKNRKAADEEGRNRVMQVRQFCEFGRGRVGTPHSKRRAISFWPDETVSGESALCEGENLRRHLRLHHRQL